MRVTKSDILSFIENRTKGPAEETIVEQVKDEKPKIEILNMTSINRFQFIILVM